jgi:hypothetical protein
MENSALKKNCPALRPSIDLISSRQRKDARHSRQAQDFGGERLMKAQTEV